MILDTPFLNQWVFEFLLPFNVRQPNLLVLTSDIYETFPQHICIATERNVLERDCARLHASLLASADSCRHLP